MSINHEQLERLVAEMEQGVAATTKYSWLDLAKEILRMREGIEVIRDRCMVLASSAESANMNVLAEEMSINATIMTGLLVGESNG